MPGLQTLDQQRAAFAWDKVSALGGAAEEYRSLVRQLPAMVQTNNLGQSLAFLMGQSDAKQHMYKHLQQWLCVSAPHPVYPLVPGEEAHLMRSLMSGDSLTLRHATVEVQALTLWLKRFAEARADDTPDVPAGKAAFEGL